MLEVRSQLIIEVPSLHFTNIAWPRELRFCRMTLHPTALLLSRATSLDWTINPLTSLQKSINCICKENILFLVERELILYLLTQMSCAGEQQSPASHIAALELSNHAVSRGSGTIYQAEISYDRAATQ